MRPHGDRETVCTDMSYALWSISVYYPTDTFHCPRQPFLQSIWFLISLLLLPSLPSPSYLHYIQSSSLL